MYRVYDKNVHVYFYIKIFFNNAVMNLLFNEK